MAPRGFTLPELVVTLAVLAIATAIAMPALGQLRLRMSALEAFHALSTGLAAARMAAISRGRPVTLCPSEDGERCRLDGIWDRGWIVYLDPSRGPQPPSAASVLWVEQRAPGPLAIRSTAGRHRVRYQPTGLSGGNNLSVRICDRRRAVLVGKVVVNLAGRTRSEWAPEKAPPPCPFDP